MTALVLALFEGYPWWVAAAAAGAAALSIAWVLAEAAGRLLRRLLSRTLGPARAEQHRRLKRLVRNAVFVLLALALGPPALRIAGVHRQNIGVRPDALLAWLLGSGLRILLILLLAHVIVRVVGIVVGRFEDELGDESSLDLIERAKRARTLGNLVKNIVGVLVTAIAVLMVLHELNVNVMPALAGAGILGLAVGFGAQTLVKDFISGFFLILENQIRVGDVATINGTSGAVEAINLRTTVLRDDAGAMHIFPNGSINTLTNKTMDYAYYVLDLRVGFHEDTDNVMDAMRQVGDELMRDPAYASSVLAPMEVFGIDAFGPSEVVIKARIKTVPMKQWEVGREYRRRLKKALEERSIEIPVPQQILRRAPVKRAAGKP
jgi:small-conductance mechanosensitive channel